LKRSKNVLTRPSDEQGGTTDGLALRHVWLLVESLGAAAASLELEVRVNAGALRVCSIFPYQWEVTMDLFRGRNVLVVVLRGPRTSSGDPALPVHINVTLGEGQVEKGKVKITSVLARARLDSTSIGISSMIEFPWAETSCS
jgi:hypothetical protein